ncbi:MAG: c-type cytochrome [Sphingomonadaceae bacterium]
MKKALATAIFTLALTACGSEDSEGRQSPSAITANEAPASPGEAVFDKWCIDCHGVGDRYPGTVSLAVKYCDSLPAALEQRKDLTPEIVALFVRQGVMVMPPFRKTEISDEELAALGAYLSNTEEPKITTGRSD